MTKLPENAAETAKELSAGKKLLHRIGRSLIHNWGFKLLSLIIALVLWAGLISQDPTLTREKVFSDATVTVTGEDTMKRNGYIVVSDLETLLDNATLSVDVPQMQYNTVTVNNYNPRIDLSRISSTGTQTVKIVTTSSSTYGSVTEVSPESMEIEVEEYITRYRIPVTLNTTGEAPAGYYAAAATLDPPIVAVSGPRSLVEKVARAEATLDLSALPAREGLVRTALPFTLLDSSGQVIESKFIEVTSESVLVDSVIAEQNLYSEKTIELSETGLVTGECATGYEIKTVTITPASISAAGAAESLSALDALYADTAVDVTGAGASFTAQIKVRKPSELVWLSSDSVTVSVEIGPVIRGKTFNDMHISLSGIGEGMTAVAETKTASVSINGPQLWVEKLRSGSLTLNCDVSGLTEGTYDLPVTCTVADAEDVPYDLEVQPGTVRVEIKAK